MITHYSLFFHEVPVNIRTTYYTLFFSLFFAQAFCAYQDFSVDHFEIIKSSADTKFITSPLLSTNQKFFLYHLHNEGNLIHLINQYYRLLGSNITDGTQILNNLLKIGITDPGYTTINKGVLQKREKCLKVLRLYIQGPEHNSLGRLTEKLYIQQLMHSVLIDEQGNTGLMLAAQTKKTSVFKYFLKAYIEQNCPLDATNSSGKTVLDFVNESGKKSMKKRLKRCIKLSSN